MNFYLEVPDETVSRFIQETAFAKGWTWIEGGDAVISGVRWLRFTDDGMDFPTSVRPPHISVLTLDVALPLILAGPPKQTWEPEEGEDCWATHISVFGTNSLVEGVRFRNYVLPALCFPQTVEGFNKAARLSKRLRLVARSLREYERWDGDSEAWATSDRDGGVFRAQVNTRPIFAEAGRFWLKREDAEAAGKILNDKEDDDDN